MSVFSIADNKLSHLPPEIGLCTALKELILDGNEFVVPPKAVLTKGLSRSENTHFVCIFAR